MKTFHRQHAPTVSIVLPTFNRAHLLPRAIRSVLDQSFGDWELIIVDDGSTDDTFDVLQPFLQCGAGLRYMHHENRGVGHTRNVGLQACAGRFVTFLDSDDRYRAVHLATRLDFHARHPEVALSQGGFEIIGDEYVADYDNPGEQINMYECAAGATFFGPRETFRLLGGFKPWRTNEDTELWRRAGATLKTVSLRQPCTYEYHRQTRSLTAEASRACRTERVVQPSVSSSVAA
jgi:glycosyltransferase involved in cell wall biosynthesis